MREGVLLFWGKFFRANPVQKVHQECSLLRECEKDVH